MGEGERAEGWRNALSKGVESFERKLWNGEYYSLWVDGDLRDECCMTDQVDGEWFTSLVGLGTALPRERVRRALSAVMRHNFSAEAGLVNASYPEGKERRFCTWQNSQAMAPWTGIEYAIASMMLDFGMVAEGDAVVRAVHERHVRQGRFWRHIECGEHYYRAMSSWALMLGATGFKPDAPKGRLTLAPPVRQERMRAPWVSSTAWGAFEDRPSRLEIACRSGEMRLRELVVNARDRKGEVALSGESITCDASSERRRMRLALSGEAVLREGGVLVVS
jgi:hypothetical protein